MPINPTGRGGSVQLNSGSTTVRQAPRNDFSTHMRNGVAVGAGTASQAIGVAAPFVPGAAVVSAAVNGAGQAMSGGGGAYAGGGGGGGAGGIAQAGDIPFNGPGLGGAGGQGGAQGGGGGGSSQQKLLDQTKNLQELSASFNLQYLQLQEKMQTENRTFTTVSNTMKTKHDTAKATINNVR